MITYTVKDVLKVIVQDPVNIPNLASESGSKMVVPTIKKTNIITLEHRGHPLYLVLVHQIFVIIFRATVFSKLRFIKHPKLKQVEIAK